MAANLPSSLRHIALFFERLPGIGQKTANRLAFYLLRLPDADLQAISTHIAELKRKTRRCRICNNLTEGELCSICEDSARDTGTITVVEDVIDLLSFETGNIYKGVYHVLHGKIDPLNHVGPEDIFIDSLLRRVRENTGTIKEVILATNPDMEGEATAMYIRNKLQELKAAGADFRISRLGYGLPIGGNLEYADYLTLRKAMENRSQFDRE
ncbi:MAG: recombination mediator RecR [Patescibacteria group bacterium]|nr:recombination mediator RecR [Patescibacteria group bacterium]